MLFNTEMPRQTPFCLISDVQKSVNEDLLTIAFHDTTFTFHSQWLHDAQVEAGPYKLVADTYTHKASFAKIRAASASGNGIKTTLEVVWNDGKTARFPSIWLRVYAPLVAAHHTDKPVEEDLQIPKGWLVHSLTMPEVSYTKIFPELSTAVALHIYETLMHESSTGILKITNLPAPLVANERKGENALVTQILKQIFGSVFVHPRRGADLTYNASSHVEKDVQKGQLLPNFDTTQLLLPHVDQSFYQLPSRIVGLYALEGHSENTFVSCPAVLRTLKDEEPKLVTPLLSAPLTIGRAAHMYAPTQYQADTSTVAIPAPGFPQQVSRFRWHPHLAGALLCPFTQFPEALRAHRTFQEIADRDTHQLRVRFAPGEMYLFDNHRVLHGRARVLEVPRTSVGQSVPEQTVVDRWRDMLTSRLTRVIDEKWLIHIPLAQVYELDKLVEDLEN